jgi:DNA-binding transcriptional MerR regulator
MKELTQKSGESKSTILYYLKEGLLPAPQKPKPNIHLYDDSCVDIIKFIKYLQQNFSYSISDIKYIFDNNKFNFDDGFDFMFTSLELLSGTKELKRVSKEEFLNSLNIKEEILDSYIEKGYISPLDDKFSSKDKEVVEILNRASSLGLDFKLIDRYVQLSKELATLENEIGSKLLEDDSIPHNSRYELLFDVILRLKPYIFNKSTLDRHLQNIKGKL